MQPLPHLDAIRARLAGGPRAARQLFESLGISQPTLSRALAAMGGEVVRLGAARSIRYALRDAARGLPDIAVHRVDADGRLHRLGTLIAVRPEGFVLRREDGATLHSEGLPWWLADMRPQGYLGRAFAARHGEALGLPARLTQWSDTHVLRALLAHGDDAIGNLLLGERARAQFLAAAVAEPVAGEDKPAVYARLAREAARGELPGSSAGGEQPKFTAHATTADGPRHVIVKFTAPEAGPVSERWRDLLLAEHLALTTLREAGIPAAVTRIVDHDGQRFLEVERFDRIGRLGRRAVFSLAALNAEFVGSAEDAWPVIAHRLAQAGQVRAQAAHTAALLWAFGTLIGNTDMHGGNLSFVFDAGAPCDIAPAYDMTPMAFAPGGGGALVDTLPAPSLHAGVDNDTWRGALALAGACVATMQSAAGFSPRFGPCVAALARHIEVAGGQIARLG